MLTEVKADNSAPKYSPAGNGFYIMGQIGGGVARFSAEGNATVYERGKVNKDGVLYLPSAGLQLNWGFSKRFANDMTLGFEAAFLSPGARLGYMINDTHHLAFGLHYGLAGKLIVGSIIDLIKKEMSEADKQSFKFDLTPMSFSGASFSYEYFTQAKNFFRIQLRVDYYGIEGVVNQHAAQEAHTSLPLVNGKASIYDITTYIGFGSQW